MQRMTTSVETPAWRAGVLTTLLQKYTLVAASPNHLPVHTLTFAIPITTTTAATTTSKDENGSGRAVLAHSAIRTELGDIIKIVIPNYKPKSYCVSALRHDEFDVTLKVYPNGRASGFIDRLAVGNGIHTFGLKSTRSRNPGQFVGVISYGVGITEALPVARSELERASRQESVDRNDDDSDDFLAKRVVLLWASRTWADTFWHDQIDELVQRFPDSFHVLHILSREKRADCLHGRIDAGVLDKVFNINSMGSPTSPANPAAKNGNQREQFRFISVGTKEMMAQTDSMLAQIGFPMPQHALLPKKQKVYN
jgi:ferredoxin-NADP reductase